VSGSQSVGHGAESRRKVRDRIATPSGGPVKAYLEERVCKNPNCDNTFTAKRKDSKYCSPRCAQAVYRTEYARPPKPKPFCVRAFCTKKVAGNKYKYCSEECRKAEVNRKVRDGVSAVQRELEIINDPDNTPEVQKINRVTRMGLNSSPDAIKELLKREMGRLRMKGKLGGLKLETYPTTINNDHKFWGGK